MKGVVNTITHQQTKQEIHQMNINVSNFENYKKTRDVILYYDWKKDTPSQIIGYFKAFLDIDIVNKTEFMRLLGYFRIDKPTIKKAKNEHFVY
jgi:hypothetical protein